MEHGYRDGGGNTDDKNKHLLPNVNMLTVISRYSNPEIMATFSRIECPLIPGFLVEKRQELRSWLKVVINNRNS